MDPRLGLMLRLSRDSAGVELLPTPEEAQREAETQALAAQARQREAENQAREAEARVRMLEAELAKRG